MNEKKVRTTLTEQIQILLDQIDTRWFDWITNNPHHTPEYLILGIQERNLILEKEWCDDVTPIDYNRSYHPQSQNWRGIPILWSDKQSIISFS